MMRTVFTQDLYKKSKIIQDEADGNRPKASLLHPKNFHRLNLDHVPYSKSEEEYISTEQASYESLEELKNDVIEVKHKDGTVEIVERPSCFKSKKLVDEEELGHNGEMVRTFAHDISDNGAKTYARLSLRKVYEYLYFHVLDEEGFPSKRDPHFYECNDDYREQVFAIDLDIPYESKFEVTDDEGNVQELIIDSVHIARGIAERSIKIMALACETYYGYKIPYTKFIVLQSNPRLSISISKKYSFHILMRGCRMQNRFVALDFFDRLVSDYYFPFADRNIYGDTCLRMCYSSKMGKKAQLMPIPLEIDDELSCWPGNCGCEAFTFFLRTCRSWVDDFDDKTVTIEMMKDKSLYRPKLVKHKSVVSPFVPVEVRKEISESQKKIIGSIKKEQMVKLLSELPDMYCDDYEQWMKITFAMVSSALDTGNEVFWKDVWDTWSQTSDRYNSRKNNGIWRKAIAKSRDEAIKGTDMYRITIGTVFKIAKEFGLKHLIPTGIETNVLDYPEVPIDINMVGATIIDCEKLNESVFESGMKHKLFAILSEKGTGKTTNLFKVIKKNTDSLKRILICTPRTTLGMKMFGDVENFGFELYSNVKGNMDKHDRIICQINSLHRIGNVNFDLVIIDECESLCKYMTTSHFTKDNKCSKSMMVHNEIISRAKNVIIMDADLSNRSLDFYKGLSAVTGDQNDFECLVNKYLPCKDYVLRYMTDSDWFQKIIYDVSKGEKIACAMASNNKATDLFTYIQTNFPKINALLIHKETDESEKKHLLHNVNKSWKEYDIVIYTPTVCMGVSYDIVDHFDRIYAYACKGSLGAQEFCQMLHRVRNPKEKEIMFGIDETLPYDPEDRVSETDIENMIKCDEVLAKYDYNVPFISKVESLTVNDDGSYKVEYEYYKKDDVQYKLYVKNLQTTITNEINVAAAIFGYLKTKGYKLEKYTLTQAEFEYGKEMDILKELKNVSKTRKSEMVGAEISQLMDAPVLTMDEYFEICDKNSEDICIDELFAVKKYSILKCFNMDPEKENHLLDEEFLKRYSDKSVMSQYQNIISIRANETQDSEEKLRIMKLQHEEREERMENPVFDKLTSRKNYMAHKIAMDVINTIGFDVNDETKKVSHSELNKSLNKCVSLMDKLHLNVTMYFNLKNYTKKMKMDDFDFNKLRISSMLKSFYGLELRKCPERKKKTGEESMYMLKSNGKWNKLPEHARNYSKVLSDPTMYKSSCVNFDVVAQEILGIDNDPVLQQSTERSVPERSVPERNVPERSSKTKGNSSKDSNGKSKEKRKSKSKSSRDDSGVALITNLEKVLGAVPKRDLKPEINEYKNLVSGT